MADTKTQEHEGAAGGVGHGDASGLTATADGPPPRAFAQGTGVLLQFVGALFFFSSCCVCSSAFLWDPQWIRAEALLHGVDGGSPTALWARIADDPARFGLMLMVLFTTLGGLALMVFGLGLQSEKPRSGWAAVLANLALLLVLAGAGACLWLGDARPVVLLWHALLSLLVAALLAFTIPALRQIRAHPPPLDQNVLPPDYDLP